METIGVTVENMAAKKEAKKQRRFGIHWGREWNEEMVKQAKQAALARDLSLSAFMAEALREKLARETTPDKPKKK